MKAILFDFGGTLDTNGIHWSEKLWEIYSSNEVPVNKEEFEKAFVLGERKLKPIVNKDDGLQDTFTKKVKCELESLVENKYLDEIDENLVEAIARDCVDVSLDNINNSLKILSELKESFKLGVVSNYYGNLETILKETKIIDLLDLVVDSAIENIYKPNPELYRIAIDRINSKTADTFIVGDSYKNDIEPGKKLETTTVWLDVKSWTRPENTDCADFTISTLSELKEIVNKT